MDNTSGTTWKVGDELAFSYGRNDDIWKIHKITKISPTGRISCGNYILNPDLTVRGERNYNLPHQAYPVTAEIKRSIIRRRYVAFFESYDFDKLTDEQLDKVMKVIKSNE